MQVTVATQDLLEILRANRAEHVAQFEQANRRYRTSMRVWFVAQAKSIEDGHDFERRFEGPVPRSWVDQYDQAIGMVQLHTGDVIELDAEGYRNYVKDDWNWKQDFQLTNRSYIGGE